MDDDDDRYAWRKYCGAGYKYNVYPENYETPEEYEADLAHAIREKGDEGKFAPNSGDSAKNAGTEKAADGTGNTGYNGDTASGRDSGARSNPGPDVKEEAAADGQPRRPKNSFFDGSFEFSEMEGGLKLVGYRHEKGIRELVIPGEVAGRKVRSIIGKVFQGETELERVTISEGVEWIGTRAFYGCAGLKEVIFPSSLRTIYPSAFENCQMLTKIKFPQGLHKIDTGAFLRCRELTEVYIPDSVEVIGINAFGKEGIGEDITIYCNSESCAWKYAIANSMNHAAPEPDVSADSENTKPKPEEGKEEPEVRAPKSGNSAKNVGSEKAADVNRNTIYNRYINYGRDSGARRNPGSDMEEGAVADGQSQEQKNSFFDGPFEFSEMQGGLKLVGYSHEKGTRGIVIPGEVAGRKVRSIIGRVFQGETELERVTVSEGVEWIDARAFYGCAGLKEVIFPSSLRTIYPSAFENCQMLTQIKFPQGLHKIAADAFLNCRELTEVYIPDSVKVIGKNAFGKEGAGQDLTIYCHPGSCAWQYAEENSMNHADTDFYGSADSETRSNPGPAEKGRAVTGGQPRRPKNRFFDGPFEFCEFPGGLELTRYRREEGIRELVIPGEVAGRKVLSIGTLVFEGQTELTRVTISEGVEEIGKNAFSRCEGLMEVIFPSSLRFIRDSAFACCSGLTEIRFPQGLRKIEKFAFAGCSGLGSVYIPDSVEEIGDSNFQGRKGVVIFCYPGSYAWKYAGRNNIGHMWPGRAFSEVPQNAELSPEEAEPSGSEETAGGRHWKRPSNKAILIGCLMVIALCVAGVYIGRAVTKHNNFVSFQNMVKEADELIPSSISEAFGEYEHVKEVTAEADSSVEWNDYYDWYTWTENFDIYVYVDDEIDDLTTLEKYEYINAVGGRALNAAYSLIDDNFPTYSDYQHFLDTEDLTGHLISMTRSDDVYIETSQNTYKYASNVKYYYVENGKDVFVRDTAGNWMGDKNYKSSSGSSSSGSSSGSSSSGSSSKSSSGSSSKKSSGSSKSSGSDPLGASDYDHPEEFYEDNYPDFDGYEDAEVYWEDNH